MVIVFTKDFENDTTIQVVLFISIKNTIFSKTFSLLEMNISQILGLNY